MTHDPEFAADPAEKATRSPRRPSVLPWVLTLCWWVAAPFLGWWLTQTLITSASSAPRSFDASAARSLVREAEARKADLAPYVDRHLSVIELRAKRGDKTMNTCDLADCSAELRAQFVRAMQARRFTVVDADEKTYGKGCLTIRW